MPARPRFSKRMPALVGWARGGWLGGFGTDFGPTQAPLDPLGLLMGPLEAFKGWANPLWLLPLFIY